MQAQTQPCPPDYVNGGPQQCCECLQDIAIGSPALRNNHGVFAHAECPKPEAPARAKHAVGFVARGSKPAPPARAAKDIGDLVADAMGLPEASEEAIAQHRETMRLIRGNR